MASSLASTDRTAGAASSSGPSLIIIVGLLLVRTVLLFCSAGISYLIARSTGADVGALLIYANVVIVAVDVITIALVARLQRRRGQTLRALIGGFRGRDLAWGLLVFAAVMVAMAVANFIANLIVHQGPPPAPTTAPAVPLWLALWSVVVMPVTVAVAEEVSYRGYAQGALAQRYRMSVAVLITAAFFGLQHAALSATGWDAMATRVITTFGVGVIFGLLRVWLRRLTPLIIGHWLFDVVGLGVPMMLLAMAG